MLNLTKNALVAVMGFAASANGETNPPPPPPEQGGVNFYVVGDFGWVQDMTDPNTVFDAINETKGKAEPGSIDDGAFFVTAGDNLYPADGYNPTDEEFATMMTLFERENLKDLKVHAIRGNHDCYFDDMFELNKTAEYDQWEMPSFYYTKEIEVGKNGEKMGFLMVDSCLMLCANYSYAGDSGGHMLLHAEHKRLRDVVCDDPVTTAKGNEMYKWINETMLEWEQDEKMLWKGTVLHHPMWGKWYPDFANIVLNYLPMLQEHKFDIYLNGHEHVISYAHYMNSQVPNGAYEQTYRDYFEAQLKVDLFNEENEVLKEYKCEAGQESFFGFDSTERTLRFKKGEALHQVTTGTSGFDEYLLCLARPSMGTFTYAQNVMHGWSSVHVDEHEFRIVSKAVDPETNEVVKLYELIIENDPHPQEEEFITE